MRSGLELMVTWHVVCQTPPISTRYAPLLDAFSGSVTAADCLHVWGVIIRYRRLGRVSHTTGHCTWSSTDGFSKFSSLRLSSALTLLVGWQEGHPAFKNWVPGAGVVVCLDQGADLHMAQLMPLPLIVSCFSKIQIGFTFLVPAHPGSPGKRAAKRVCVRLSSEL